jgi:hypothetical protein
VTGRAIDTVEVKPGFTAEWQLQFVAWLDLKPPSLLHSSEFFRDMSKTLSGRPRRIS